MPDLSNDRALLLTTARSVSRSTATHLKQCIIRVPREELVSACTRQGIQPLGLSVTMIFPSPYPFCLAQRDSGARKKMILRSFHPPFVANGNVLQARLSPDLVENPAQRGPEHRPRKEQWHDASTPCSRKTCRTFSPFTTITLPERL